jgi:hypothetical protein
MEVSGDELKAWIARNYNIYEQRWNEWAAHAYACGIDLNQTPVPSFYHNRALYILTSGRRGYKQSDDDFGKDGVRWLLSYLERGQHPELPPPPPRIPWGFNEGLKAAGRSLRRSFLGW